MNRLVPCSLLIALAGLRLAVAAPEPPRRALPAGPPPPDANIVQPELVDIRSVDPSILIDLRYAGSNNIAGRPLYPPNFPALVRPSVAAKLALAQSELVARGYKLKIWDAYRPKPAHEQLWQLFPNVDYVGNPNDGIGSLHTWGVAVDATIVDSKGRDLQMPTDFDAFTPAAMLRYTGKDPVISFHLHVLQRAMAHAGFFGLRTEWWHFISRGWTQFKSIDDVKLITGAPAASPTPAPRPQTSFGAPTAAVH